MIGKIKAMAAEIAAEALEIEKLGIEEEILKKAEDEIKLLKSEPPSDLPDLEDVSCEPGEIEYDYVKKDLEPGNDTLDLITSNEKVLTKLDDTNPEDIVLSPVLSPAPDAGRKRKHFKNRFIDYGSTKRLKQRPYEGKLTAMIGTFGPSSLIYDRPIPYMIFSDQLFWTWLFSKELTNDRFLIKAGRSYYMTFSQTGPFIGPYVFRPLLFERPIGSITIPLDPRPYDLVQRPFSFVYGRSL